MKGLGSVSYMKPLNPWCPPHRKESTEEDRFDRLEKLLMKSSKSDRHGRKSALGWQNPVILREFFRE